ncbi:hypothetical protein ASE01_20715 [Nocardioides sp. Root190]|uniref:sensor domain-containing diguanylate cyclase n=1 Tax=Nocardioides sp. Root190 TaxID=1736488 RepID=UPI0006F3C234|nr:sensor domain-containing diguanylate cyclase [Nocardioides sp. Root190]KRB73186.1 hypothetical protein ASE01_20715 [Nocardioides sp. Root190]
MVGGTGELWRARPQVRRALERLPRGGTLDASSWARRHRGICNLLWLHVALLPAITVLRGDTLWHALPEVAGIAWVAVAAEVRRFGTRARSAAATLGLMACSAAAVHVFDGVIEAHFHFFVMVAVVALYQSWLPYLLALAFVLVHHGLVGTLVPESVYNHQDAIDRPWLWGLVHGGFIVAESIACLVYWRASELAVERERQARLTAEQASEDLAHAQELSGMGSWEWDAHLNLISWSDHLYALTGVDPSSFIPSLTSFQELVHPEDRDRVNRLIHDSVRTGTLLEYECRIVRGGGEIRRVHALGHVITDADGVVVRIRGTIHDVTERRRLEESITQMAFHDALTGLCNRRLYLDRLRDALTRTSTDGTTCAVLFLDLDGFKAVNDAHGHAMGDSLLQEVAIRLRAAVRQSDTVARFGGDEFAVLCEGAGHLIARSTAQRIERELDRPILVDRVHLAVAVSIGIAVAESGNDVTPDELLRRADAAMYEVKTSARPTDSLPRRTQSE